MPLKNVVAATALPPCEKCGGRMWAEPDTLVTIPVYGEVDWNGPTTTPAVLNKYKTTGQVHKPGRKVK